MGICGFEDKDGVCHLTHKKCLETISTCETLKNQYPSSVKELKEQVRKTLTKALKSRVYKNKTDEILNTNPDPTKSVYHNVKTILDSLEYPHFILRVKTSKPIDVHHPNIIHEITNKLYEDHLCAITQINDREKAFIMFEDGVKTLCICSHDPRKVVAKLRKAKNPTKIFDKEVTDIKRLG